MGRGEDRFDGDPLHPGGARHGAAQQGDPTAAGQRHLDGGPLGRGDQFGGLLLQDHLVPPVQTALGELAQLPVAARIATRRTAPDFEVRLQQVPLARRTLLQQPPFDGSGGLADHGVQRGVRVGERIAEAEHAFNTPTEQVPDGNCRAGVGLGAFGEVLGPVDIDQLPFRERQPDPVRPAEPLGEHEARDALDRGQVPHQGRFAEPALQHRAAPVGEGHIHVPAREPTLKPVQYGHRGADEPPVQIEILAVGKFAAVRGEAQ